MKLSVEIKDDGNQVTIYVENLGGIGQKTYDISPFNLSNSVGTAVKTFLDSIGFDRIR